MAAESSEALAQIIPPELRELLRSRALLLQRPVWGRRHGRHRSARAGLGLDFRDHRPYVAGDDPRRLDWRAVARRDRLVLRQTEAEDELPLVLVTDAGGGMAYGEGPQQKIAAARAVAGGLAWLALRQGDRVGLVIGQEGEVDARLMRPSGGHDREVALARALLERAPAGACPWSEMLAELAPRLPQRSLVVLLSDFLDPASPANEDPDAALQALLGSMARLRARQHDVVLVQVLHRDELEFPWTERRMLRFVDLWRRREPVEGPGAGLREGYLARLGDYLRGVESRCEQSGLFFERLVTDTPLAEAFVALLGRLAGLAGARTSPAEAPAS